jgi:hypothetical protein
MPGACFSVLRDGGSCSFSSDDDPFAPLRPRRTAGVEPDYRYRRFCRYGPADNYWRRSTSRSRRTHYCAYRTPRAVVRIRPGMLLGLVPLRPALPSFGLRLVPVFGPVRNRLLRLIRMRLHLLLGRLRQRHSRNRCFRRKRSFSGTRLSTRFGGNMGRRCFLAVMTVKQFLRNPDSYHRKHCACDNPDQEPRRAVGLAHTSP